MFMQLKGSCSRVNFHTTSLISNPIAIYHYQGAATQGALATERGTRVNKKITFFPFPHPLSFLQCSRDTPTPLFLFLYICHIYPNSWSLVLGTGQGQALRVLGP